MSISRARASSLRESHPATLLGWRRVVARGLGCLGLGAVGLSLASLTPQPAAGQPPADMLEAMKRFSQQAESFVPDFVREIPADQRQRLAGIHIDWRDEQQFGRQVLESYEAQLAARQQSIKRQGRDVLYLDQLVAVIQPLMRNAQRYRKIRVGIIPSDQADAYSIPGGDLLFTRGLLETAGSEAGLIGVVAHELSHLDRGHQLLPLKQSKLNSAPTDWRQMMGAMAVCKPVHPEFEREADADALQWMLAAGYDVRELAHVLAAWDQRQNVQAPWVEVIPGFVRSHPDAGQRAQDLLRGYDRWAGGRDLYVGRENLQRRIPRDKQRF